LFRSGNSRATQRACLALFSVLRFHEFLPDHTWVGAARNNTVLVRTDQQHCTPSLRKEHSSMQQRNIPSGGHGGVWEPVLRAFAQIRILSGRAASVVFPPQRIVRSER
jgi:hypothetical protein